MSYIVMSYIQTSPQVNRDFFLHTRTILADAFPDVTNYCYARQSASTWWMWCLNPSSFNKDIKNNNWIFMHQCNLKHLVNACKIITLAPHGGESSWSGPWHLRCTLEVFHVHGYQDQFIQPGWAECFFCVHI